MLYLKSVLIIFCLLFSGSLYSQIKFTDNTSKPQYQPPSPEASSLAKYGDFSVNLNTGIPDITIPIYSIQVGNFTFPISISYNASGVRLAEVASRVGLGWSLNAGGVISRNIIGLDDNNGVLIPPSNFNPSYD